MTILTIEVLKKFFLWMTIINFGLLSFYFIFFLLCRGFIYRLHGAWFKMTEEKLNSTLYKTLAFYKIIVIAFNLVPYIVLVIIS